MTSAALKNALAANAEPDAPGVEADSSNPLAILSSPVALRMISESLPAHMDAATFQRHAITLVKQTPKLLECEPASVAQGIVRGAALGLDPDPALGQMWLVPRRVNLYNPATKNKQWIQVATFQVGYKGLYELAMRTGRFAKIEVHAVHAEDLFEASLGSDGKLIHEPDWFSDRGEVRGWYAYAQQKDGAETFEVLSVADAERHRDRYAPRNQKQEIYGPWIDHFEAMAEKTVFIKLAKWLPKSVELAHALEDDGKGWRQPLGGHARADDVIELPALLPHTPTAVDPDEPEGQPDELVDPEPLPLDEVQS